MARERGYFDLVDMLVRTWPTPARNAMRAPEHAACGCLHVQELHTVDERMQELSHTAGVRLIQELAQKATKEKQARTCVFAYGELVLCKTARIRIKTSSLLYSSDRNN